MNGEPEEARAESGCGRRGGRREACDFLRGDERDVAGGTHEVINLVPHQKQAFHERHFTNRDRELACSTSHSRYARDVDAADFAS